MKREEISLISEERKVYDKMDIALAIKNSTYDDDLGCSLIDERVIESCEGCNLRGICEGIDKVCDKYVESTTKVLNSFKF